MNTLTECTSTECSNKRNVRCQSLEKVLSGLNKGFKDKRSQTIKQMNQQLPHDRLS